MSKPKGILLVDEDDLLRDTLLEHFGAPGEFNVRPFSSGQDAITAVREENDIDLVLLDMRLPDMDGRQVCQSMRENGLTSPIIMFTDAKTNADDALGLHHGANEYIAKPFKIASLLACVRAHLLSHEHSEGTAFTVGPFEFRPALKLLVCADDRKIRLTEKETFILKFLYHAAPEAVSRNVLLDEVWGYNAGVTTHTLETHVYRLRQKIEPDPSNAAIILTENGGYRLNI